METLPELILETLEDLGKEDFEKFQWFLQQPLNLEGLQPIPKSLLEDANRLKTADLIMQRFPNKEPQVMIHVLKTIDMNDLVERFLNLPKGR